MIHNLCAHIWLTHPKHPQLFTSITLPSRIIISRTIADYNCAVWIISFIENQVSVISTHTPYKFHFQPASKRCMQGPNRLTLSSPHSLSRTRNVNKVSFSLRSSRSTPHRHRSLTIFIHELQMCFESRVGRNDFVRSLWGKNVEIEYFGVILIFGCQSQELLLIGKKK